VLVAAEVLVLQVFLDFMVEILLLHLQMVVMAAQEYQV